MTTVDAVDRGSATRPSTTTPVRTRRRARRATAVRSTHSRVVRRTMSTRQVLVAGLGSPRLAVVGIVMQPAASRCVEHVGEAVAQLDDEAGEEAVGLVHLRRAAPLGGEGGLGVGRGRQRVLLEQRDRMPGAGERERATASPPTPPPTTTTRFGHRARPYDMVTAVAKPSYADDAPNASAEAELGRRPRRGPPGRAARAAARRRLRPARHRGLVGHDGAGACARRARLNPRYFYESFDDLDALVVAVYDRLVERARRQVPGRHRGRRRRPRRAAAGRHRLRSCASSTRTAAGRGCSTSRRSATRRSTGAASRSARRWPPSSSRTAPDRHGAAARRRAHRTHRRRHPRRRHDRAPRRVARGPHRREPASSSSTTPPPCSSASARPAAQVIAGRGERSSAGASRGTTARPRRSRAG